VRRQWGRRRTTWAFGLLLALPLVLVGSFFFGERSTNNRGGATTRIFDLAQSGAANFSLVLVFLASELLLVLLAALFCGDAVPSEASWSSLRYLLIAPVQRARLLTSKLAIGIASTLLATVLLPAWGLLAFASFVAFYVVHAACYGAGSCAVSALPEQVLHAVQDLSALLCGQTFTVEGIQDLLDQSVRDFGREVRHWDGLTIVRIGGRCHGDNLLTRLLLRSLLLVNDQRHPAKQFLDDDRAHVIRPRGAKRAVRCLAHRCSNSRNDDGFLHDYGSGKSLSRSSSVSPTSSAFPSNR